jgi:hypothetical protein
MAKQEADVVSANIKNNYKLEVNHECVFMESRRLRYLSHRLGGRKTA